MSADVFDQVARDYERIHNRSLPPGVRSDEFVAQKAAQLVAWLGAAYRGRELRYLDFGCGNGRLFRRWRRCGRPFAGRRVSKPVHACRGYRGGRKGYRRGYAVHPIAAESLP